MTPSKKAFENLMENEFILLHLSNFSDTHSYDSVKNEKRKNYSKEKKRNQ